MDFLNTFRSADEAPPPSSVAPAYDVEADDLRFIAEMKEQVQGVYDAYRTGKLSLNRELAVALRQTREQLLAIRLDGAVNLAPTEQRNSACVQIVEMLRAATLEEPYHGQGSTTSSLTGAAGPPLQAAHVDDRTVQPSPSPSRPHSTVPEWTPPPEPAFASPRPPEPLLLPPQPPTGNWTPPPDAPWPPPPPPSPGSYMPPGGPGSPASGYFGPSPGPEFIRSERERKAVLSLIFGLVTFLIPVCAIPGLVLGIRALSDMSRRPWLKGKGQAIAGIVTSVVFLPIGLAIFIPTFLSMSHTHRPVTAVKSPASAAAAPTQDITSLQADIDRVGLQPSDAPSGYAVIPYQDGTGVAGQVTLDLCNGNFPSENLRVARNQVALAKSDSQQMTFSTEAVVYQNPAATAQAFAELQAAKASCPDTFVPSLVEGEPPMKTTFEASPDVKWPQVSGVQRLTYLATVSDQEGHSETGMAVYLRHGQFLLGLYFPNPGSVVPIAGQTTPAGIANLFAERLTALPATGTAGNSPTNSGTAGTSPTSPASSEPQGSALTFSATYAHFSASFPSSPRETSIPESIGNYHMTVYIAVSRTGPFEVAEEDVQPSLPSDQISMALVSSLRGFAATSGLTVTSQPAPISYNSFEAYAATYSNGTDSFRAVSFASSSSRVYILFAPEQGLSALEASLRLTS